MRQLLQHGLFLKAFPDKDKQYVETLTQRQLKDKYDLCPAAVLLNTLMRKCSGRCLIHNTGRHVGYFLNNDRGFQTHTLINL